jgi:hypothetical protein
MTLTKYDIISLAIHITALGATPLLCLLGTEKSSAQLHAEQIKEFVKSITQELMSRFNGDAFDVMCSLGMIASKLHHDGDHDLAQAFELELEELERIHFKLDNDKVKLL